MPECNWREHKGTFDINSPFMQELKKDLTAISNGEEVLTVNGRPMGNAVWNLILSKRDLSLFTSEYSDGRPMKMKPHIHWRVNDVKRYFGISGTHAKLMANFMALYHSVLGDEDDE